MNEFKHVLVPVDFSESSARALDVAVDLAARYGASLTLVHACETPVYGYSPAGAIPFDYLTPLQDAAGRELREALAAIHARCPDARALLRSGVPADEILATAAERGADLIVMGTHGRRGIRHMLLGSVAERVVRASPVPVLTVRDRAG